MFVRILYTNNRRRRQNKWHAIFPIPTAHAAVPEAADAIPMTAITELTTATPMAVAATTAPTTITPTAVAVTAAATNAVAAETVKN